MTTPRTVGRMVLCVSMACAGIAPAQAQQRVNTGTSRWEIGAHIGGGHAALPSAGTASPLPVSSSFLILGDRTSLLIPSWYLRDGSQLFNSLPTSARVGATITPLDPALAAAADGRSGIVAGGRVARMLTRRFSAEVTIDYSRGTSTLPAIASSAAEESRASFERAFTAFFTSPTSPWVSPTVTSTMESRDGGNGQVVALGALLMRLRPGRWTPFVAVGGGAASMVGDAPSVSLTGRYDMQFLTSPGTFRETDVVSVSYELSRTIPVFTVGGGATYEVSRRTGLRVELRGLFGRGTATTRVRTHPLIEQRTPGHVVAFQPATGDGLQFSNNRAITGRDSTLSAINNDWETFRASGSVRRIDATAGWYWRF